MMCTSTLEQIENFLNSPPLSATANNCLNLCTNTGLDLTTCQGLNLSQTATHGPQSSLSFPTTKQVGLNLSLQSGVSLRDSNSSQYTYNNYNVYDSRNLSPLNLEQRSSPLNLTNGTEKRKQDYLIPDSLTEEFHYLELQKMTETTTVTTHSNNNHHHQNINNNNNNNSTTTTTINNNNMNTNGFLCNSMTHDYLYNYNGGYGQTSMVYGDEIYSAYSHSNSKIRLFCQSCGLEFPNGSELNRHMERHSLEGLSTVVLCSQCGMQFRDHSSLEFHIKRDHRGVSSNVDWNYVVDDVAQNFVVRQTSGHFQESLSYENGDGNELSSKICSEINTNSPASNNLYIHNVLSVEDELLKESSSSENVYSDLVNNSTSKKEEESQTCLDCLLNFPSGLDLKKHIDLIHEGRQSKEFQCLLCALTFSDKVSHGLHVLSHGQNKAFLCELCDSRFGSIRSLKRHRERVHDKTMSYSCHICKKGFYEKHDLRRHSKVHYAPKCTLCSKKLNSKKETESGKEHGCSVSNFNVSGESFPCEICKSVLSSSFSWGYHMWKHTKDPSYIKVPSF